MVMTRSGIDEMEFGTLHTKEKSERDWLVFGEDRVVRKGTRYGWEIIGSLFLFHYYYSNRSMVTGLFRCEGVSGVSPCHTVSLDEERKPS